MAGKAVGEFSLKMITITNTPGPAGSTLIEVNFEGTGTGRIDPALMGAAAAPAAAPKILC
jgi:hypothetical protein